MAKPGDMYANVVCECGHQFEVVVTGQDPHRMQFTCLRCGRRDGFSTEQATAIVIAHQQAVDAINEMIRKALK